MNPMIQTQDGIHSHLIPSWARILIRFEIASSSSLVAAQQHLAQAVVYDGTCRSLVDQFFCGYNTSILVYGQTGSGLMIS
jgi:hypothetical protein